MADPGTSRPRHNLVSHPLGPQPDRHDHQPGQEVGEVRAVDRDRGEPVDPAPGHQLLMDGVLSSRMSRA